jgi:hypothetical protein
MGDIAKSGQFTFANQEKEKTNSSDLNSYLEPHSLIINRSGSRFTMGMQNRIPDQQVPKSCPNLKKSLFCQFGIGCTNVHLSGEQEASIRVEGPN